MIRGDQYMMEFFTSASSKAKLARYLCKGDCMSGTNFCNPDTYPYWRDILATSRTNSYFMQALQTMGLQFIEAVESMSYVIMP